MFPHLSLVRGGEQGAQMPRKNTMSKNTIANGQGDSALRQWENIAHSMATILGQWLDEGDLADIADLKSKASAILDKYESMEDLQS